jgi:hypothetical protein
VRGVVWTSGGDCSSFILGDDVGMLLVVLLSLVFFSSVWIIVFSR